METSARTRSRWRYVLTRDQTADGRFVYAVRTTGIYCRPSCPSRRPSRAAVEFFATPAAAERAGYRPCRRCEPHRVGRRLRAVIAACRYIDAHVDEKLPLQALARQVGMSGSHLQRLFTRIVGVSPREYQEARRIAEFKRAVSDGGTVSDAAYAAGFGSSSRLYEKSAQLGMTPARYRRRGAGLTIRYTTFRSALGTVLLAATERGLCSASLGDNAASLLATLHAEFGAATLKRDDVRLRPQARLVASYLAGSARALDLPLDVGATAFQRKVWNLLRRIPYGTTRSYGEIAGDLDTPHAARAVARAVATNPVALVIPCHRAIGKSGELTGYRWGLARKAALLALEGARKPNRNRAA